MIPVNDRTNMGYKRQNLVLPRRNLKEPGLEESILHPLKCCRQVCPSKNKKIDCDRNLRMQYLSVYFAI